MSVISAILTRKFLIVGASAVLLAGLLIYHRVELSKANRAGYYAARAEMAAEVARANAATLALEQRQRQQSDAAAAAWESKRNDLQSQVDRLVASRPVVRLCKSASSAPVSKPAAAAGSFDDPAGRGVDAVPSGPDIGLAMVRYGADCERYRQQVIELQKWVEAR